MEPGDQGGQETQEDINDEHPFVSREELYDLVWAEPMLRVAAKFQVSSSYMGRICGLMNVPRPVRGYWAKLAVGQKPPKPELPSAGPSHQLLWNRTEVYQPVIRPLPRPPAVKPKRRPKIADPQLHPLIHGAKEHFEVGRTSYDSKYLKPAKRLLVDLVASKAGLDKALGFANSLFQELEANDVRVTYAPHGEHRYRAPVDEHEVPRRTTNPYDEYYRRHWAPSRNTVAFVGTVAVGLTLIELSEEADARYINGEWARLDQLPTPKRHRYRTDHGWTSKHEFPTGRFCLQAYSPDRRGEWTKQWRETKDRDLTSRLASIVRELLEAAPVIAGLIEEGERQAEVRRVEWEAERREMERKEAEERAAKAIVDSRADLLRIIDAWAHATKIEEFFASAEARLGGMNSEAQTALRDRLGHARQLVGTLDAMERFRRWKAPSER